MNMNAVGIDVSKRKSTVAILRPGGEMVKKPFDVPHLSSDFRSLKSQYLKIRMNAFVRSMNQRALHR